MLRSSHPEVFCKKGVLKNFLRSATLLKKTLWHRCFPVNVAKFLRTPFFIEHLRWLLLNAAMNIKTLDRASARQDPEKKTNLNESASQKMCFCGKYFIIIRHLSVREHPQIIFQFLTGIWLLTSATP